MKARVDSARSSLNQHVRLSLALLGIALAVLVIFVPGSAANLTGSSFEGNDGNMLVDNTVIPNTDWVTYKTTVTKLIDMDSGTTDNSFAGGTKENDYQNVGLTAGSIPNKDDLLRAYAASESTADGSSFLYLSWVRLVSNGDAHIDFELNQDGSTDWSSPSTVNIRRTQGDLLISYDFVGNLNQVNITSFTWDDTLKQWTDPQNLTDQGKAEGAVNVNGAINDEIEGGSLGAGNFGEAAINLKTTLSLPLDKPCETFGSMFAKTRSSGSGGTAQLKDLILPQPIHVSTCGSIELKKHWVGATGNTTLKIGTAANGDQVASTLATADGDTTGTKPVVAGDYYVSETAVAGYTSSLACFNDLNGNGTQDSGEEVTPGVDGKVSVHTNDVIICTFTNTKPPALHLRKVVVNDNGGTKTVSDFTLTATGTNANNNLSGTSPVDSGSTLQPDTWTLSETTQPGYSASAWVCTGGTQNGNQITVGFGGEATCTITNDDIAPKLHLRKVLVNDNGGTKSTNDFTLTANGTGTNDLSGTSPVDSGATLKADTWTLSETNLAGYTASAWSCTGGTQNGNQITVGLDGEATCTITNDDIAPKLHLRKVLVNDNGGTKTVADFTLTADGSGSNDLSGTSPVDSGATLKADTWTLSETTQAGYTASAWVCTGGTQNGNQITVGLGGEATCTITNDDIAPKLHLRKVVVNDNGGTKTVADFGLTADGTGTNDLSGTSPVDSGATLKADTWTLSETNLAGYTASDWVCTGGSQSTNHITVGIGGEATCTITNDDIGRCSRTPGLCPKRASPATARARGSAPAGRRTATRSPSGSPARRPARSRTTTQRPSCTCARWS